MYKRQGVHGVGFPFRRVHRFHAAVADDGNVQPRVPAVVKDGKQVDEHFAGDVYKRQFYPFADLETISPCPLLFIAGEKAHSMEFSGLLSSFLYVI